MLEASQLLRMATKNPEVLRRNDAAIREAERSISYFENTLAELQARKRMAQGNDHARSGSNASQVRRICSIIVRASILTDPPLIQPSSSALPPTGPGARGPGSPDARYSGGPSYDQPSEPARPKYSALDLIRADTPYTTARISKMLHQLEFKLQVEMQYKKGIDKMAKLYQAEGDKRSKADAESKRVESERKIQLLQTALKRYKTLHILDEDDTEDDTGKHVPFTLTYHA